MRRKTRIGPSWLMGLLVPLALLLAACGGQTSGGSGGGGGGGGGSGGGGGGGGGSALDFNIALSPASLTVQQGSSGNTTLTLTPQNGFTGTVTLSLVDASTGNAVPDITLPPTSFTVSTSSPVNQTLTVNVANSVATGSYSLKVRAVSGSINKEASLSLTVNSLLGSTWIQLGSELNISSGQDAESPSLALDASGNPVVAWQENVPGQYGNIYVKRWDSASSSWVQLGNELDVDPLQNAVKPSLALDASGNPVVAWTEWDGSSNNVYVKRWDGTDWVQLGGALDVNPAQNAISHSLALDSANRPVVAFFENDGTSFNIYVKRWDGTNWVLLGGALDVNLGEQAYDPSLALDASGNPVVAWHEHTPGQFDNIYVKRWDGTGWVQLGGALDVNVNDGAALASLALDASGNPVVAWTEWNSSSSNVYVKRWDGAGWVPLGNELDISEPQMAERPSLALDASGRPAVAWFENDGTSNNIYVKRWDGASWLLQGSELDIVLNQAAEFPKVAMDGAGYPVVVWQEQTGSARHIYVKRRLP
jgi:hypothetical protein